MSSIVFRPLRDMQDYYRYMTLGSDWVLSSRADPAIGYSVYMVLYDPNDEMMQLVTANKVRGYLSDDGWRYMDGRRIEENLRVGMWIYDEASRGCIII